MPVGGTGRVRPLLAMGLPNRAKKGRKQFDTVRDVQAHLAFPLLRAYGVAAEKTAYPSA